MARIVKHLELNKVAVEYSSQDLGAPGQSAVDLGGGPRRVDEIGDADAGVLVPQKSGQKEKVIVVNHDGVALCRTELMPIQRQQDRRALYTILCASLGREYNRVTGGDSCEKRTSR